MMVCLRYDESFETDNMPTAIYIYIYIRTLMFAAVNIL